MDVIPWPIAYGVGGGSLVVLVTFGVWFLRQLAKGYDPEGKKHGLVAGSQVAVMLETQRQGLAEVIRLHELQALEKDKTIDTERTGRKEATDALKVAIESNKIIDDFFLKTGTVAK